MNSRSSTDLGAYAGVEADRHQGLVRAEEFQGRHCLSAASDAGQDQPGPAILKVSPDEMNNIKVRKAKTFFFFKSLADTF